MTVVVVGGDKEHMHRLFVSDVRIVCVGSVKGEYFRFDVSFFILKKVLLRKKKKSVWKIEAKYVQWPKRTDGWFIVYKWTPIYTGSI